MLGLTTTRRLRAVQAGLQEQLTQTCTAAELEQRRLGTALEQQRQNLRGRLDRALSALAATRRDLSTANGALQLVAEQLLDQRAEARS
ncbi:hypothetical protein [Streptomyces cylindrosporus]|uniref:Uncharacterized protein n=1 Tax=Streptomyces cylindrosporus TaxID=2927583 RepID=A0ABS9YJZ0_9ACTN|nr:hypothetical protein [Streptomyces cylindrosporus]MCI3277573.1 hypothetical protein [Streptomyces cylindrosporus]